MKKAENWVEKLKGIIKKGNRGNKGNKEDKGGNGIPKEILDRLPPGVKIKRIEIGPKQIIKLVLYLILIFWVIQVVWQLVVPETIEKVPLSTAIEVIKEDRAEEVTVMDNEILIKTKDGGKILVASKEAATSMAEILQREGIDMAKVKFQVENRQGWKILGEIVSLLLSVGLPILVIFWFLGRQTGGGAGGMFGFGKSTAKLFVKGKQNTTFKDVAGVEEAKKDLEEVVDFLKHPEKYKKMGARTPKGVLLVGPSGVGKCITGESLVLTNKGLMEIRDVPKYYQVDDGGKVWGAKVCSLDTEKTRMEKGRASNWYQLGEHKTKKILTEQGYEIEGTFEHPVVVGVEGKLMFKRLDELKKGEAVAISFGQEVFGKRKDVDRQTAYLLGVLTGDGNLSVSSRVGLTNSDAEIIDFFRNYVTERYPEAKVYKKGKYDYIVTYWRFKKDLYKVGMSYLLSFDKEVPKSILQGKRELVVSFIRGLFDTDGCVQKNRSTIEYTSVSERLIRQVQMLLLNMGVVSSLQVKDPAVGRNKKRVYRLTVTGDYLVVYHDKVGFGIKRKQERLRNMAEKIRNKSNTNIDLFYGVGHLVEDQWRNLSKRGLSNEWWSKRIHHIRSRNRISRNSLKLFVDYCRQVDYGSEMVDYFRRLLEAKLFFSLVKESKDSKGVVYDFTIPQNHSFVSSGFVSHNTLLAKAVAGEADVPFYSMAGSEFMEMLVGVGASVVGDTPVLVREEGERTRLVPIKEVVDKYYKQGEADRVKKVKAMETLGFDKAKNGFWGTRGEKLEKFVFGNSNWKKVEAVYRHKVKEIYEVEFLDGKIETTGDHSVFVRTQGWVVPKRVDELKEGDVLVNLPMNTRKWDEKLRKTIHIIKGHLFPKTEKLFLDVWQDDKEVWNKYQYAVSNPDNLYQSQLAVGAGVNQMTISNWQRGMHLPQSVSKKLVKLDLPNRVEISEELMWLFGIYTAEGRGTNNLEFTFGIDEKELVIKTAELMNKVFGIGKPKLQTTEDNSIKVIYYSAHLGRLFTTHCGNGSHNKHVPGFIWNLSKDYFVEFLRSYVDGDGYVYKEGKVTAVSVSRNLIRELAWLCSMHGIKTGIRFEVVKGGRIIKNKPLPESKVWKLIIGKSSNPFETRSRYLNQFKKCYVKKITKKKYEGYVYDLCGVENEGFFGGEKPILLHNSRVRDLFATAKRAGKAIIFIDEIDAIGRVRGGWGDGGHGEREQTLNQILVEMDGFEANTTVIVLAATNRGDLLDPALMRPGRFDRRVVLEMPDIEARKEILKIHARGKPFDESVDWEAVARRTVGFSGADLENMLNEAAIKAARENKDKIEMADIEEAALKVKLGAEKKRVQTDEDKLITAYHEAGHAIVNFAEGLDPVHRISIVSRGMALGYTLVPPKLDRVHETRSRLIKQMAMAMGGRAAEEMRFKDMTTGAAVDISQASTIAREMVVEWGMSSLGPVNLGPQVDLDSSRSYMEPNKISEGMKAKVDEEIKKLTDAALARAKEVLKENSDKLDKVAKVLVEKESLDEKEFEEMMK